MALLALVVVVGCSPHKGSCSWLQPTHDAGIEVTAPREAASAECNCIGCAAPGEFSLERNAYTVEIWNGDRWYPELLLRARAPDGSTLLMRSPQLRPLENPDSLTGRWREFDYVLGGPFGETAGSAAPLRFEVLKPSGEVLGEESVQLELVVRTDYSIEFI
jgi:hypothetical protein